VLDLRAVLAWSPAGKSIGGENLDPRAFASEGEALDEMSRRTREAIFAYRVPLPDRVATGLTMFTDYSLSVPARLAGREVSEPWFRAAAFAFALAGMALAGARFGVVALVPLAAGLGYVAPLVAIDFYLPRFGEPISWIGLVYIAGVLAILIDRGARRRALRAARVRLRGAARLGRRRERGDEPVSSRRARRSPAPWRTGALALLAWMVVATCALLAFDRRPLPRPSAAALLADPRVANLLRDAGIERGGELEREIERAVASRAGSTRVLVGVAHLPTVVPPGGPRLRNIWFRFRPASETYTALLLAAPWKGPSGRFELRLLTLPGELYSDFRNGDEVVAIVDETGASAFAARVDFAPTLRLRTIFPTRWADP
jgi:hypothetical protein